MSLTEEVRSGQSGMSRADKEITLMCLVFIAVVSVGFWLEHITNPKLHEIKSMVVVDKSDTGYIVCNPKEMTCYTMTSSEEIIIGNNVYGVEDME